MLPISWSLPGLLKVLKNGLTRRIPYRLAAVIFVVCLVITILLGLRDTQNQAKSPQILPPAQDTEFTQPTHKRQANYEQRLKDDPENGPGEGGLGVPEAFLRSKGDKVAASRKREGFNIMASDVISLERRIQELRHNRCIEETYDTDLPTASVVIVFYNEPWSTLVRTIKSVINRSRPEYLKEIILVDDKSDKEHLSSQLDDYIITEFQSTVRVLRAPSHAGLIQARLLGAKNASGEVLVFLDAHCEVAVGWLEPLLQTIKNKRKIVVCPMVDTIKSEDMSVVGTANWATGLFTWSMFFKWGPQDMTPSERKRIKDDNFEPHRTPTFPGGIFAINREWFFEVGSYDERMERWGGENLEMSFRVWMCGGEILFHPCSHVPHLSRGHAYTSVEDEHHYHGINSARLAEVWLDDYKELFYLYRPDLKNASIGDLTSRKELRKKLECKTFKWYLDNVYPEKFVPNQNVTAWGQVRDPESINCIQSAHNDDQSPSKSFILVPCLSHDSGSYWQQMFSYAHDGQLRREEWCLDLKIDNSLEEILCSEKNIRKWTHEVKPPFKHEMKQPELQYMARVAEKRTIKDGSLNT